MVRQQAQAGIDVVERRRVRQVDQLVAICAGAPDRLRAAADQADAANPFKRGADRTRFAEFYAELDAREGVATTTEAICVGPIKYTGQAELQRDIDNFKAALKNVKVEEAFLPVAAPASVIPDRKNEYLQERRGIAGRDRRGDAHRIQDDRRRRLPGAARRCAQRRHL